MLLATLLIDYPILRETLSRAPDTKVTWEQSDLTEVGDHQMLVWVDGGGSIRRRPRDRPDRQGPPTGSRVRRPPLPTRVDGRRSAGERLSHRDRSGQRLTGSDCDARGMELPRRVPERRGARSSFTPSLWIAVSTSNSDGCAIRTNPLDGSHLQYGITDRQRETLVAAVDAGYLGYSAVVFTRRTRRATRASRRTRPGALPGAASRRSSENTVYPDALSRRNARVTRPVRCRGPKSRQGIPGRATPAPLE